MKDPGQPNPPAIFTPHTHTQMASSHLTPTPPLPPAFLFTPTPTHLPPPTPTAVPPPGFTPTQFLDDFSSGEDVGFPSKKYVLVVVCSHGRFRDEGFPSNVNRVVSNFRTRPRTLMAGTHKKSYVVVVTAVHRELGMDHTATRLNRARPLVFAHRSHTHDPTRPRSHTSRRAQARSLPTT